MRSLEHFSKCRVKTARAYSSAYDDQSRWPDYNFTDVVKYHLDNPGRVQFDVLVTSAPTVDITNLNTSQLSTNENTEYFQQKVVVSSQNMFSLAKQSLEQNPSLRKVILMEHPPRFDAKEIDPTSLKSKLARLANATLSQLWLNSHLKDKIIIGRHSLESTGFGDQHLARYRNTRTGRYDGIHFYGPSGCTDYTNSVKTILMLALSEINQTKSSKESGPAQSNNHSYFQQTRYQNKPNYQPTVKTANMFSVFNSNLGN